MFSRIKTFVSSLGKAFKAVKANGKPNRRAFMANRANLCLEALEDRLPPATNVNVTIAPPAGWTGSLPDTGMHRTFTFTVTATGPANTSETLYWSVGDSDPISDDEVIEERLFDINYNAMGMGTYSGAFALFSSRAGEVKGVDGRTGEYGASDPAEIYVHIESLAGTDLGFSPQLNVAGAAHTLGTPTTMGTYATMTAAITLPPGFNGDLNRNSVFPTVFSFTVTITGATPNTTFENLRWSVIEPDIGTSAPDDELWYERSFSIPIGPGGGGTYMGQFTLFASKTGQVGGVDESSGEINPDPIYVLIENSAGTDLASSLPITVHG